MYVVSWNKQKQIKMKCKYLFVYMICGALEMSLEFSLFNFDLKHTKKFNFFRNNGKCKLVIIGTSKLHILFVLDIFL